MELFGFVETSTHGETSVVQTNDKLKDSVDFLEKIKTMPALESFDENDLKELLRISKIASYKPDELIVEEKAYEGWIYYLISGRVGIVKKGIEIAQLRRVGDLFGDMGPMGPTDLDVSIFALDETTCLKINLSKVEGLASENRFVFRYAIFRGFAEVMAKRLRITTEKYLKAKEELDLLHKQLKARSSEQT